MACWELDDWINLILFITTAVVTVILYKSVPIISNIQVTVVPYNLEQAQQPTSTCRMQNLNISCVGGFTSAMAIPTANGATTLQFEYVWYNSAYSTTECRDPNTGLLYTMKTFDGKIIPLYKGNTAFSFGFVNNSGLLSYRESNPQSFNLSTSYPFDTFNNFSLSLISTLAYYQQLGIVIIDSSNNLETFYSQLLNLESTVLNGIPWNPVPDPSYASDMTNSFIACNSDLNMECTSLSEEAPMDYFMRMLSYAGIAQFVFTVVTLVTHAVKNTCYPSADDKKKGDGGNEERL